MADVTLSDRADDYTDPAGQANRIFGLAGDDTLRGTGGSDTFDGGDGIDTIDFGQENYVQFLKVFLNNGTARYYDSDVGDFVSFRVSGIENLIGSRLQDTFVGNDQPNSFVGMVGADTLEGGGGSDTLAGGDDDPFGRGGDVLRGGDGFDYARHDEAEYGDLVIDLANPSNNTGVAKGDSYESIEGIIGGRGNDAITGNGVANALLGQAGNDVMLGGGGNDTLAGGAGNDTLSGGLGADALRGGDGFDTVAYLDGGAGNLVINLVAPSANTGIAAGDTYSLIEGVFSGAGNDTITGNGLDNLIISGAGADTVLGGAGNDTLSGGDGADTIAGGEGADAIFGDDGFDYARYDDGAYGNLVISFADASSNTGAAAGDRYFSIEGVFAGNGSDTVTGDANANILFGQAGSDSLYGGDGIDILSGGNNADLLFGGNGADQLLGGLAFDYARYDDANYGDLVINLGDATQNTGAAAGDTYVLVEGILAGAGNDTVTGAGAGEILWGLAGDDVLDGLAGNDILIGGQGADRYTFTTDFAANNVDGMVGFLRGTDKIVLSQAIFGGIGDQLDGNEFGGADEDTLIVYDQATGVLSYDQGGADAGTDPVRFALLAAGTVLDSTDFMIIA